MGRRSRRVVSVRIAVLDCDDLETPVQYYGGPQFISGENHANQNVYRLVMGLRS